MTDTEIRELVERLRECVVLNPDTHAFHRCGSGRQAADALESLSSALAAERAKVERLRAVETAARALKFSAYPAHGSGFVFQVSGGNINDLETALAAALAETQPEKQSCA